MTKNIRDRITELISNSKNESADYCRGMTDVLLIMNDFIGQQNDCLKRINAKMEGNAYGTHNR